MNQLITYAMNLPILTLDEEKKLINDYFDKGNLDAAKELVNRHIKIVVAYASRFKTKFDMADLVQEGCIGLMKALKVFDPSKNARFSHIASMYVRESILNFVINNTHVVKIATTKEQRTCFFNLHYYRDDYTVPFTSNQVKMIAAELEVSESCVLEMEQRLFNVPDVSADQCFVGSDLLLIDAHVSQDGPEIEVVEKEWSERQLNALTAAIDTLDDRSKDVILNRWAVDKPITLKELAVKHNVSMERVRQIESRALNLIKQQVN